MASTEPSNPGVDSSPLTADSITTRGLIVGAVSAALLGLGCSYATLVLRGSYMALDFTTPGALVMLLLLVTISSGLLRRVAPRLALTPAELATAHIMLVVASAIPTMGLSAQIIPLIAAPFYLANSVNRWGDTLIPHLPEWACPKDSSAIIGLFEGSARATVPWSDWLPPLLAWLPMIAALYLAMICIMVIIRKQWADNERLPFPVIQLPLDMITGHDSTTQRPFFGQGRLWLGFAVAFIYASMMGVRAHYPQMPLVRDWWWFLMFRRRMWMYVHISWPMLGFFYL
ncbi:MAG TPA: DUF6785 family protein, partial [Armatimonadota bacterium]|nr:DUF6785 family protein [Armatimonadota bacterium]